MSLQLYDPAVVRPFGRFFDEIFLREYEHPLLKAPYWRRRSMKQDIGGTVGEVIDDSREFAVSVDVSHFAPEELSVRVTGDGATLLIEGKHVEKIDHRGSLERSFVRRYALPEDAHAEAITSTISKRGVLKVSAPKAPIAVPWQDMNGKCRPEGKVNKKRVTKKNR